MCCAFFRIRKKALLYSGLFPVASIFTRGLQQFVAPCSADPDLIGPG
jgi:hypothetical protein